MRKRLLLVLPILLLSLVLAACGNTTDQTPGGVAPGESEEGVAPGPIATQEGLEIQPTEEMTGGETGTGMEGTGTEVEVSMENIQFVPVQLTIDAGTTVLWTNNDSVVHTVTSGTRENPDGLFDSGDIESGGTFSYTFDEPGTYDYYCIPHPGMEAVVIVP